MQLSRRGGEGCWHLRDFGELAKRFKVVDFSSRYPAVPGLRRETFLGPSPGSVDVNLQAFPRADAKPQALDSLMRRRRCQVPIEHWRSTSGFSVAGGPSWRSAAPMSDSKARAASLHIDINTNGSAQTLPHIAAAFLVKFDVRKG
jgi:hypothetical protein